MKGGLYIGVGPGSATLISNYASGARLNGCKCRSGAAQSALDGPYRAIADHGCFPIPQFEQFHRQEDIPVIGGEPLQLPHCSLLSKRADREFRQLLLPNERRQDGQRFRACILQE